jgi:hypothetical protein
MVIKNQNQLDKLVEVISFHKPPIEESYHLRWCCMSLESSLSIGVTSLYNCLFLSNLLKIL